MIQALRYEPQGQRQQFEPRQQQHADREEQDRHIHLHFHLNLTFRANQGPSTQPNAVQITRIFAALVAATLMVFSLFIPLSSTLPSSLISNLGWISILAGLAIAWSATLVGGLPLLIEAWRSTPRVRTLLALPFLLPLSVLILHFLQSFGLISWLSLGPILAALLKLPPHFFNSIGFFFLLLYSSALISTFLFNRTIRQATIPDSYFRFARAASFVVVAAMALILLGALLVSLYLIPIAPMAVRLPFLLGMGIAVIIAIYTLSTQLRSRNQTDPRPKNDSPSDFDSFQEPRGY